MTVLINRSIPLSQETRNAWTSVGAIILPRNNRRRERIVSRIEEDDVVIHLGAAPPMGRPSRVYNERNSINAIRFPHALRRTLPNLIPPPPVDGEAFWIKRIGQHGSGVTFYNGRVRPRIGPQEDIQRHIEGTEYRVITVGELVVQATRKENVTWQDGRHSFDWRWIGVDGIRQVRGAIPLVKRAVEAVPNGDRTVIGWDIIQGDDRCYIIEANSSPGVNEATARRIVNAVLL